ncbi:MAG: TlpA family protein disulfide reductase [Candidatus Heimdallarchaeota archaeon]|nr:TlpA family protein disulfide reductase [Candidatus Heimdallarchaeota archaeon]MCK5157619.1 TlpA family protein disulfide reductase [Candidatus Heimdallarchaeota archaeon]
MKSKIFLLALILLGSLIPFITFVTSTTDIQMIRISPNIQEDDFGIDWTLKEIFSDRAISFRDFYGKVVILDFFATWCVPCIESFGILRDLNAYYSSSQVAIISIDIEYTEKTEAEIEQFAQDNEIDWNVVIDSVSLADDYSVLSIPSFFIFDQKQKLVKIYTGVTNFSTMKKTIDDTLDNSNQRSVSEFWSKNWFWFVILPIILTISTVIYVQRRRIIQQQKEERQKKIDDMKQRERKKRLQR